MQNCINMRPHHLLCLPGYKGYGYDKNHGNSWDEISAQLKENPDTNVRIVEGKDSLCKACPNDGSNGSKCNQRTLSVVDEKVQQLLDLKDNAVYKFSELMNKIKEIMTPEKHKEICGACQWRAKGLCNDTFEKTPKPEAQAAQDEADEFACVPV